MPFIIFICERRLLLEGWRPPKNEQEPEACPRGHEVVPRFVNVCKLVRQAFRLKLASRPAASSGMRQHPYADQDAAGTGNALSGNL